MDEFDYAIFRYLSPDGLVRFWGSRRVIDPRISVREIAERVRLSEAGVRARMERLRSRGILRGSEAWLNPSLFESSLWVAEIPVRGTAESKKLLEELALVDGVTFARDILDEEDRKIRVHFVSDSPSATERRFALLKRISPAGRVRGPLPYWTPPCRRALTPLDWRFLRAFRARPDSTVAGFSSAVKVGRKTAAARLHGLLDARACWWTLGARSEEMPLALLTLAVRSDADRSGLLPDLLAVHPSWIPVAADGFGVPPGEPNPPVLGLVPAEGAVSLERAVQKTLEIEAVTQVRRTFALGSVAYPAWFDEGIARRLGPRG